MRVLVAGIGNVFLGDDGFGVEVARRLQGTRFDVDVDVADFGIRGVHLAYELADGRYGAAILVDAVSRGRAPGTLYVIEPEAGTCLADDVCPDAHSLTPDVVLSLVHRLGQTVPRIVIVGCEPAIVDPAMELSPEVAASIDTAVEMVRSLVAEMSGVASCA